MAPECRSCLALVPDQTRPATNGNVSTLAVRGTGPLAHYCTSGLAIQLGQLSRCQLRALEDDGHRPHINVETPVPCAAASPVVTHEPHSKRAIRLTFPKTSDTCGSCEYLFARLLSLGCVHLFVCAWQEDTANTNCVCCADGQIGRDTSFISPTSTADLQLVVVTNRETAQPNSASEQKTRNGTAVTFFSYFLTTPSSSPTGV